jgi:NAD+ diphosphatase
LRRGKTSRVSDESGPRLDRASHLRKDVDRLMSALDAPDTLLVPVFRDSALTERGAERALLPSAREASALIDRASEIVWLGRLGERDCFALDISEIDPPLSHPALSGGELSDLRLAAGLLPAVEAELLVYARGMLNWHRRHRFCPSCGKPTKPREGGHVRLCESEDLKHFPRTDPAAMVLVTRGDRCVLARQPGWPQGFYAAIAGFVEPGESIEDAALREVKEELGIAVEELVYSRSQPWPFPSSLMIGYTARATGDALTIDREELEDARWFSREELRNPKGFFYPPAYSLAHHLIRAFLEQG